MRKIFYLFILCSFVFSKDLEIEKLFFDEKISGTIVIESLKNKTKYIYNEERAKKYFVPASTFKILNTLITLNEKIVDENSIIVWDKKTREYDFWNKNQSLESAFKYSCVWCYREFAQKVGLEQYKIYLKKLEYGNQKISSDISSFWLDESLKITTFEQIEFLKNIYNYKTIFPKKDIDYLKEIMLDEINNDYKIFAKTGWNGKYGWYIGFIETKDDIWFFATNIDTKIKDDLAKRKDITLKSLKLKKII